MAATRIGTSGFAYKEWLGGFYPAKLPGAKMLASYAERLSTVEINYTFQRTATPELLQRWAASTPPDFRFSLKAPQEITHRRRLKDAGDALKRFSDLALTLGDRLGAVLFQLPPFLKSDLPLLKDFLAIAPKAIKSTFEFRHESWLNDETFSALAEHDAALCIAETEGLVTPVERTASHVYLRLRLDAYDDAAIKVWARKIHKLEAGAEELLAYFRHGVDAPALALNLLGKLHGAAPARRKAAAKSR
jgi:uncharacterized protein YecE (DUF72 family)